MSANVNVQDWFKAALLHDLGKTRGWNIPGGHGDWSQTTLAANQDLKNIAALAKEHESAVSANSALDEIALLALADKLQKGLYGSSPMETGKGLNAEEQRQRQQLLDAPWFDSFFGQAHRWDDSQRQALVTRIAAKLQESSKLWDLMGFLDAELNRYPHTTYIPHLALSLHQQLTAAIFFLMWRKAKREELKSPLDLEGFTFHTFAITPQPLAFFYRMRYLAAYRETATRLERALFQELYASFRKLGLNELQMEKNPFQFFRGSSLVLLYDDEQAVVNVLQNFLDKKDEIVSADDNAKPVALDAIQVQAYSFTLRKWGENAAGKLYADPEQIERRAREYTLIPLQGLKFESISETRCEHCGRPTTKSDAEALGIKNLCSTCTQIEQKGGLLDLEKFCQDEYLGWIFLSFGTPLLDIAWEQADIINSKFAARHLLPSDSLHPSETGLDEYVQALAAIQAFQAECERKILALGNGAYTLARFTHLAIYLLCEEKYWGFLDFLNQERERLRIPTSLRAFLCGPKHPVWSLMERGAQYDSTQRDLYYHIAQGSVTMFTNSDVNTIRTLGTVARSERVPRAQLSALVQTALQTSQAELFLEIDARAQDRPPKIGQRFPGQLKNGLDALKGGDDFQGREKRAIFIKYISKLRGED